MKTPAFWHHLKEAAKWTLPLGTLIGVLIGVGVILQRVDERSRVQIEYIRCIAQFFSQDSESARIININQCDIVIKQSPLTEEEKGFLLDLTTRHQQQELTTDPE